VNHRIHHDGDELRAISRRDRRSSWPFCSPSQADTGAVAVAHFAAIEMKAGLVRD
jgi:hypothetical protein